MHKSTLLAVVALQFFTVFAFGQPALQNAQTRLIWRQTGKGWTVSTVAVRQQNKWTAAGTPSGLYQFLYAAAKPDSTPTESFTTNTGVAFPEPVYKYQKEQWKQSIAPVALNTAGQSISFYPSNWKAGAGNSIQFTYAHDLATVEATWGLDPAAPGDIIVTQTLTAKRAGYFSLASPTLSTLEPADLQWATVPGYFQGDRVEPDFVTAYAYGQGVPARPVLYRERSAGSLTAILSHKNGITSSIIPDPLLGRDPWLLDHNTHQDWNLALSHMNRDGKLSPTMYYPVLGEPRSSLQAGETISYSFRFSLLAGDWYQALKHVINDASKFHELLSLRRNRQSLSSRVEEMHGYLVDARTSRWNIETFNGQQIGGQSYLGGVVGSQGDAMKNSDYGAMWMLARATGDSNLVSNVLPYALNFKTAQQQMEPGFFRGAAIGQYYLTKSKKFTEEWGAFVEPIGLTYYTMLDIGNILLFDSANTMLRDRLRMGGDLLLQWQKPGGNWEVAYDKHTEAAIFKDLQDLRPTFYGLMVAYRILGDEKYLVAARRGADWFIEQAVKRGRFLGVCGDARYVADFATAQSAQALLDLYDITHDDRYKQAAISTAKIYTGSIYTHPLPTRAAKMVNGRPREDWEIAQSGLSFEHGGIFGSSNSQGPIQLCSHAGLFLRMFALTNDTLFADMARAAAIGRDAFVDSATSVASYYWRVMNRGSGPYPHHAWWQIGWITDYLMAEATLRSNGAISFPRGFVTPKVGPHQSYGFAPGRIYGQTGNLIIRKGLVDSSSPDVEYIVCQSTDQKRLFITVLNDRPETVHTRLSLDASRLEPGKARRLGAPVELNAGAAGQPLNLSDITIPSYGLRVFAFNIEAAN